MAARLNKKYFGNRNIGSTSTTSDDGIGGEGVASVTIGTAGSYTSALPTVSFSTPDIPTGVRATGIVHGHALSAVATAAGTGYHKGDVLTLPSGAGVVTQATFTVSTVKVVTITLKNGGSANDAGDIFDFSHASLSTPIRVRVTTSSGGVATGVEIVDSGVWTATGALPAATDAGGFTRTQSYGSQDMNGQNLQVNLTGWGVNTVAVAQQGDYTAISSGAKATTGNGTGATLTVTYGVSGVAITEKGSGYTSASDAAPTFSAGAATGTSVLTTDSGNVSSATNQENALVPYAYIGGSRKIVDIIGQKGARRYKVTDGTNVAVCQLVTGGASSAAGQMDLTATDSAGGQYWVLKLNNRRCTVVAKGVGGGSQFATGSSVPWTFDAATANQTVKLGNA